MPVVSISFSAAAIPVVTEFDLYDKNGDQHYDIISAFIKSMRGSDPDATLYYLARMLDLCGRAD